MFFPDMFWLEKIIFCLELCSSHPDKWMMSVVPICGHKVDCISFQMKHWTEDHCLLKLNMVGGSIESIELLVQGRQVGF